MTKTLLIENDEQTSFRVWYDHERAVKGTMKGGVQITPNCEEDIEIEKVELVYTATEEIIAELDMLFLKDGRFLEMIESDLDAQQQAALEAAADAKAEEKEDDRFGIDLISGGRW